MSSKERNALGLLIAVGLVGHGVRLFAVPPDAPPGGVTLIAKSKSPDLPSHRAKSVAAGRPLRPDERIDLNRATKDELARLPGVGPGVAKAILKARTERRGFGSLAELDSVPGVGPKLLAEVLPHLALDDTNRVRSGRPLTSSRAQSVTPAAPLPPRVVRASESRQKIAPNRPADAPPLRLNSASENDLLGLPGIGPTRARAIMAYRQSNGPFASVWDLEKVPGLSARLVRQLASQVVVP